MIDAAVAAGVKRFIPSHYAPKLKGMEEILPELYARLKPKVEVIAYLKEKVEESRKEGRDFSWSAVGCGPLFDWVRNSFSCLVSSNHSFSIHQRGFLSVVFRTGYFLLDFSLGISGLSDNIPRRDEIRKLTQPLLVIEEQLSRNQPYCPSCRSHRQRQRTLQHHHVLAHRSYDLEDPTFS